VAPDAATLERMKSQYLGCVSEVDAALGRLVAFLKAAGEWDRTMLVLTSDHGEQLGEHRQISKLGFYRSSFEVTSPWATPSF
jgi:arylsulfatase A-like enzyme